MSEIIFNEKRFDISGMSTIELLFLKAEIEKKAALIKIRIDEAKQKAARYRKFSDPEWFRSISEEYALKIADTKTIQVELSIRKELERGTSTSPTEKTFYRHFVIAAKKYLTADDFDYISKLAELYEADEVRKKAQDAIKT